MDFRRARKGMGTLVEMMFRRAVDATKWAAVGGLVVVVVAWLLWRRL
jgi:hypothetical protein